MHFSGYHHEKGKRLAVCNDFKGNLIQNQSGQTAPAACDCYFSYISLRHLDLSLLKELRIKGSEHMASLLLYSAIRFLEREGLCRWATGARISSRKDIVKVEQLSKL